MDNTETEISELELSESEVLGNKSEVLEDNHNLYFEKYKSTGLGTKVIYGRQEEYVSGEVLEEDNILEKVIDDHRINTGVISVSAETFTEYEYGYELKFNIERTEIYTDETWNNGNVNDSLALAFTNLHINNTLVSGNLVSNDRVYDIYNISVDTRGTTGLQSGGFDITKISQN